MAGLQAWAGERRQFVTGIAREYVEGRGVYPDRIHTISLIIRFLSDYYDHVDAWASWAGAEIESWGDIRRPPDDGSPLDTLAHVAALRPAR